MRASQIDRRCFLLQTSPLHKLHLLLLLLLSVSTRACAEAHSPLLSLTDSDLSFCSSTTTWTGIERTYTPTYIFIYIYTHRRGHSYTYEQHETTKRRAEAEMAGIFGKIFVGIYVEIKRSDGTLTQRHRSPPGWSWWAELTLPLTSAAVFLLASGRLHPLLRSVSISSSLRQTNVLSVTALKAEEIVLFLLPCYCRLSVTQSHAPVRHLWLETKKNVACPSLLCCLPSPPLSTTASAEDELHAPNRHCLLRQWPVNHGLTAGWVAACVGPLPSHCISSQWHQKKQPGSSPLSAASVNDWQALNNAVSSQ